jgi:hypothetical protein
MLRLSMRIPNESPLRAGLALAAHVLIVAFVVDSSG